MWLYLLVSSALKGQSRRQDAGRNQAHIAVHFLAEPESLHESSDPLGCRWSAGLARPRTCGAGAPQLSFKDAVTSKR